MELKIKKLKIKRDNRGWVTETIRAEDVGLGKFGQILVSTAYPGQTKGNHYHLRKREWYCVIKGRGLLTIFHKKTGRKKVLEMGERNMVLVEIPRGYFHAIKNIGEEEMFLLAYTDEVFDPHNPDTYYEQKRS